ncbi:hypothetical protein AVEN_108746-1 [Araneus ventricosus]|uniref:Uncharacterized protein n=1 Tax=Araneus ventricosus TaxID=182803 RepID=A0A4Y2FET8_ARAVE|nr:hypothetical protein AVEN_108746-1 [Araneus ventricosus]
MLPVRIRKIFFLKSGLEPLEPKSKLWKEHTIYLGKKVEINMLLRLELSPSKGIHTNRGRIADCSTVRNRQHKRITLTCLSTWIYLNDLTVSTINRAL